MEQSQRELEVIKTNLYEGPCLITLNSSTLNRVRIPPPLSHPTPLLPPFHKPWMKLNTHAVELQQVKTEISCNCLSQKVKHVISFQI